MVRIVCVVPRILLRKWRHRSSFLHYESARVKNSPRNQNRVISFVKEPQNKTGGQSSAIRVVARERDQSDDTRNSELRSFRSRRAKINWVVNK